ncbi:MAG: RlmE family RNA methyltransferase [Thermoplasmata archaeon]
MRRTLTWDVTLKVVMRLFRDVTKAWIRARRRDRYYRRAKAEGYRSRAAYKLLQINERFGTIRPGDVVVDLGAAPGGWSQVAGDLVGAKGRVVALDMVPMAPLERVTFLRGDLREEAVLTELLSVIPEGADVVLSDMSPKLSGNKSLDHGRSIELANTAFLFAEGALKARGNLVVKVFQGDMYDDFRRKLASAFETCKGFTPKASLAKSSEIYLVGKGWRGAR